jgi:hypothetical protein
MQTTRSLKILIVIGTLLTPTHLVLAAEPQLQIIRGGKFIPASSGAAAKITAHAIALLESASVNSTPHAVTNSTWTNLLASKSFLHVTFPAPREVNIMMIPGVVPRARQPLFLNEIVVPLPEGEWPQHIYARIGTNLQAVCKYSPIALKRLTGHPTLGLSKIAPYKGLANLPDN